MNEHPFVKNGKTLLSGIDPVRRAERTADSINITNETLYFCPSPIYGYGLEKFLLRLTEHAKGCAVLCVEADSELFDISQKEMASLLSQYKNLHLTNTIEDAELAVIVRKKWGERSFRRIEMLRLTGGWQLHPELYETLCDTLRRETASEWSNALTLSKLGRLYIRNFFRNLSLLQNFPSIAELSFGSTPVLVLGAGPSLDETLDQITGSREQGADNFYRPEFRPFKIVCVDTCLGALKDRDIVPDLVVVLESQHWNLRDFTGCRDWNVSRETLLGVPIAIDLSALPASARVLNGAGFIFFTPWTHLRIFERLKNKNFLPAVVPPLGSVGLTAVEIARRLTTGNIICSGLDFSFSADKYHARGTPGHRRLLNTQTRLKRIANVAAFAKGVFTAKSKSNTPVYSSPNMKNYRDLFEREFGHDLRLYDIEGNGLSLGIKTINMDKAMLMLGIKKESHTSANHAFAAQRHGEIKSFSNSRTTDSNFASVRLSVSNSDLNLFLNKERAMLQELRNILTGESAMNKDRLNLLLDECDYLWAHFPDCKVGHQPRETSFGVPGLEDISFLKRVRAEIDPMMKVMGDN